MKSVYLIVSILFMLYGCSSVSDEEEIQAEKRYPDQESWGSQIVLTKDGKRRAIINAGHFEKYNDLAEILMDEGVDVDFFDINEVHLSHLKSEQGRVNEKTNDLFAHGNVIVVSDSGVTLYTEQLRWDNKKEKIISDVFIELVTERDTITGLGFESDSDLKNWSIFKPTGITDRIVEE